MLPFDLPLWIKTTAETEKNKAIGSFFKKAVLLITGQKEKKIPIAITGSICIGFCLFTKNSTKAERNIETIETIRPKKKGFSSSIGNPAVT
jgi:hypothetical protein